MFKKLYSKKGQVSMEMGILVASAVAVAAIASYFYAVNVKYSDTHAGETAKNTSDALINVTENVCGNISEISIP
ncbi:class III signal peptide-containing protein [Methanococcus maripaludis]|uniref:Uncharacterized protein (UPF0333 family) n=1 Tax=Methanococcus maripaludis TaxID=39152 RepID=A0A7J9PGX3_METMI|nr:class III signal peptide-containing protein [Methanococcus maripaludis]MBA2860759.1 uncharacterized protein (UPF0333 family) [Methanococcus maripaludis]